MYATGDAAAGAVASDYANAGKPRRVQSSLWTSMAALGPGPEPEAEPEPGSASLGSPSSSALVSSFLAWMRFWGLELRA